MTKVTFISSDGKQYPVDANDGLSLMESARRASVPKIIAECGGACACATCHIYIDEAWMNVIGPAQPMEKDMIEFADDPRPNSRLACQIKVTPQLDGLIIHLPA